jgi:hypothetical protein
VVNVVHNITIYTQIYEKYGIYPNKSFLLIINQLCQIGKNK